MMFTPQPRPTHLHNSTPGSANTSDHSSRDELEGLIELLAMSYEMSVSARLLIFVGILFP